MKPIIVIAGLIVAFLLGVEVGGHVVIDEAKRELAEDEAKLRDLASKLAKKDAEIIQVEDQAIDLATKLDIAVAQAIKVCGSAAR
jgi:hypothetical protein